MATFEEMYMRVEPSRYLSESTSSWLDDKVNSARWGKCSPVEDRRQKLNRQSLPHFLSTVQSFPGFSVLPVYSLLNGFRKYTYLSSLVIYNKMQDILYISSWFIGSKSQWNNTSSCIGLILISLTPPALGYTIKTKHLNTILSSGSFFQWSQGKMHHFQGNLHFKSYRKGTRNSWRIHTENCFPFSKELVTALNPSVPH